MGTPELINKVSQKHKKCQGQKVRRAAGKAPVGHKVGKIEKSLKVGPEHGKKIGSNYRSKNLKHYRGK